jgi:hypothetical protein
MRRGGNMFFFKRMNRERKKRYWQLREIRQERDYQIGKRQYANRPYTFPSLTIRGKRKVITTKRFMKDK